MTGTYLLWRAMTSLPAHTTAAGRSPHHMHAISLHRTRITLLTEKKFNTDDIIVDLVSFVLGASMILLYVSFFNKKKSCSYVYSHHMFRHS